MQLNKIAQSFILAGLLTSASAPLIAAEAPKDATASTQQANMSFSINCPSPITPTLPMLIKASSPLFLRM